MTDKKRPHLHSLRAKLVIAILVGILAAAATFFLANGAATLFIERQYMSEKAVLRRNERTVARFQSYVDQQRLASTDTGKIAEWTIRRKNVSIGFYAGTALPELPEQSGEDPAAVSVLPVRFTDRQMMAIVYDYSEQQLYNFALVAALVLAGLALTVILLSNLRHLVGTILALNRQVQAIGEGDLQTPISSADLDELGSLVRSVDAMRRSILRKTEQEAEARQKNSELITAMSHDLRNPLTALMGYLELASDEAKTASPALRQYLGASREKAAQLRHLTDELFRYALVWGEEDFKMQPQTYNADVLLAQLFGEFTAGLEQLGLCAELTSAPLGGSLTVDVAYLRRVLDNLLDNLRKYADPAEAVKIRITAENGCTIRLYNRVLPDPQGTESNRIGLKICERILRQMGGSFEGGEADGIYHTQIGIPLTAEA